VPADFRVRLFAAPACVGWGRLRDVSSSGTFIETRLVLASPSALWITLGPEGLGQVARAFVVRQASDGLGVEWYDDDAAFIAHLVSRPRRLPSPREIPHGHRDR